MNFMKTTTWIITGLTGLTVLLIIYQSKNCQITENASEIEKNPTEVSEIAKIPTQDHITSMKNIPFLIVMCNGKENEKQIKLINVLLKSAAILTRTKLKFIISSDSESLYNDIIAPMKLWPEEYQRRLEMNFDPVRYPANTSESFRATYKVCATYCLLLPEVMVHIDAAVYMDTDTFFLSPPDEIFKVFDKFDEKEVIALAPSYSSGSIGKDFLPHKSHPYPGRSGYNSGVMPMNFTRLRSLRSATGEGFSEVMSQLFKQYKGRAIGDQDILNIYLSTHLSLLHEMGCNWNYIIPHCRWGRSSCVMAEKQGISILHGAGKIFGKGSGSFKDVHKAMEQHEIGTPIHLLITKIIKNLEEDKTKHTPYCNQSFKNITFIFTNQLSLLI